MTSYEEPTPTKTTPDHVSTGDNMIATNNKHPQETENVMPDTRCYRGHIPSVRCRDLSGMDCNMVMLVTAEHCGDPSHIPIRPDPKPTEPMFISNRKAPFRRPTLTVSEEFDFFIKRDRDADRALPDLTPDTFDVNELQVSTKAQVMFVKHHNVSESDAIEEIRLVAQQAMTRGKYHRESTGFHRLVFSGYTLRVTPDGEMVTKYKTLHRERTPSQVLAGVPSRFVKHKKQLLPLSCPIRSVEELSQSFDPTSAPLLPRAIRSFMKYSGMSKEDPDVEQKLRLALARACDKGTWGQGNSDGRYLLFDDKYTWVIGSDEVVISVWVPDE